MVCPSKAKAASAGWLSRRSPLRKLGWRLYIRIVLKYQLLMAFHAQRANRRPAAKFCCQSAAEWVLVPENGTDFPLPAGLAKSHQDLDIMSFFVSGEAIFGC